jgi:hypothetical protein
VYDWTGDDDVPIVVESADIKIDGVTVADLLTINDPDPVALHIPADHDITAGSHRYSVTAVDDLTGDTVELAGGLLRVRELPGTPPPD